MPPKISLAELYTLKDKKELSKYVTFDSIINICHKKIKNTEIPFYIYGKPLYKIEDCVKYIVESLRNNGFFVQILPEPNVNMIYVSWNPGEINKKKLLT
jgi:hypothetical protein